MDLRFEYSFLHLLETQLSSFGKPEVIEDAIKDRKRSIRSYLKRHEPEKEIVLVHDDGIDGYLIRYPVPEWCDTEEDAKEWFMASEYMECRPSMYDCTGQLFTSWFSFHKLNGKMWVWHGIARDC